MTRICSKDGSSVRCDPVASPVVLVPDQGVPVDQEHHGGGHEGPQVLGGHVVRHLPPGELAEGGHSHGDGRVDVASGHLAAQQQAQYGTNAPSVGSNDRENEQNLLYSYPQFIEKKSPLSPSDKVLWAIEPQPKTTNRNVPVIIKKMISFFT